LAQGDGSLNFHSGLPLNKGDLSTRSSTFL